jgi:Fe2+ or Zn2+ uptake regulation protein
VKVKKFPTKITYKVGKISVYSVDQRAHKVVAKIVCRNLGRVFEFCDNKHGDQANCIKNKTFSGRKLCLQLFATKKCIRFNEERFVSGVASF